MGKILTHIILLGDFERIPLIDLKIYFVKTIMLFYPIMLSLDFFNLWFTDYDKFNKMLYYALVINAVVGGISHAIYGTFNTITLLRRNAEIIVLSAVSWFVLSFLGIVAGDNIAGEAFTVLIQLSTLLYPISKTLKNVFILSRGSYPPEWVMRRLYNFEKNGDLKKLFETEDVSEDVSEETDRKIESLREKIKL